MALEFVKQRKESNVDTYEVTERLALTEDGRVVPEDSPEARWLYAIPGQQIPLEETLKYGLVAGDGLDDPFVGRDGEVHDLDPDSTGLTDESEPDVAEVPAADEPAEASEPTAEGDESAASEDAPTEGHEGAEPIYPPEARRSRKRA